MASLMTKLDAVNLMLESVWETPVSTLDVSGVASVALAKRILDHTSASVQGRGWAFNSETFKLTPNSAGEIELPHNTIAADSSGYDQHIDAVMRGNRLYNRKDNTYTFAAPLTVECILLLDFEELPQSARVYIATFAARSFRDKWLQQEAASQPTPAEVEALRNLEQFEADSGDFNVFCDSYSVASILDRR